MSEKVRAFNRVVRIEYDIDVGGRGHKSEWIAKGHNTLSLVDKAEYDRLAEINKVLTEALGNVANVTTDGSVLYCRTISRSALAKAKEMGK